MKKPELLLQHSLWLLAATFIGHGGNYVFHVITGRMLSDQEYGLMMSLFAAIQVVLMPMSALGLALTRAVTSAPGGEGLYSLFKIWIRRILLSSVLILMIAFFLTPWIQTRLEFNRLAPILLAAAIPCLNLLLTLSGAGLRGLQLFDKLALQGSILFGLRAALVGFCLWLGFRAAGWALLAHVIGMSVAFLFAARVLYHKLDSLPLVKTGSAPSVSMEALRAIPILISFAILMSTDVLLARMWFPKDISGQFAQAATLGRMILWLPLPVAQAMFPKVVRSGPTTSEHRKTAIRALGYTVGLVIIAVGGCWVLAPLGLRMVFGIESVPPLQVVWLRWTALAMAPLAPLYLLMHYELARGKIYRLLPFCFSMLLFIGIAFFRHHTLVHISQALLIANLTALIGCTVLMLAKDRSLAKTSKL